MSSVRRLLFGKKRRLRPRREERLAAGFRKRFRPRIGIRVWLTALFVLVTAFAGATAYEIVRPMLYGTLYAASDAEFRQVGEQYENLVRVANRNGEKISLQRIKSFAASRDVQWGVVRAESAESGTQLDGDLDFWRIAVAEKAVDTRRPQVGREVIPTGDRAGQVLATYAAPINVKNQAGTAVVFTRYYTESETGNVPAVMKKIKRLALLAGALALLIAGFSGYAAADLISKRVSRLGVAAEKLAAGNFGERIETRIEDEVGALGSTFNAMAASLEGAFRQVEQEKERGRAILDGMTDAVVGVDDYLNPIFLNPRARELLESTDRAFQNRLQKILAETRHSGPMHEPEVEAGDRIMDVRAAPLEEGALAILRDVTEERHIERAKAEFIANASHELKTPLFALSGYLEMLEDEGDEEVRATFLEDMKAQTGRLQSLTLTLLDLSRLDANAVTFRHEEVDLEDMLHELRRDFGYTGRPVNIHAEEDVPSVETDPNQLHRMLAILVDNAIKYSGEGSPVDLDLHREDGHAVVSVRDEGCGIPEAEQGHIFDRFYRAQGSSRANGTGLGLALAGEISGHLGGEIRVHSKPDAGSTFSVALPLVDGPDDGNGLGSS